ncbi:NAD-binding protein [Halobellus sp. H-GB7]|uniref:potassium channel family protein n=1 Tax=Halobellus sp. H-GB7 TaxID=3069756 RepID=UPI0027B28F7C|nr:NAD-binding protein [Halobellus sp. H-GB7]MDQ2053929.1 NAD-binding protein [Halobellus sp. H-GB7]
MAFRTRRGVYYLALVVLTTLVFTAVYNAGMAHWENRPQPLYRSLEVVIQTFTTTGYGEDAPWQTFRMNALAIVMQLTGIGLILTAVDVLAVPWLRDVLTPSAPESMADLRDHVVICGHTPHTDTFITELDARDREYVLVEADADTARELHEDDYQVIHGDPESTQTLENAQVQSAVAVVADVADDTNASIALAARDAAPEVRIITLIQDTDLAQYHRVAGAESVLSPRQLLGESLAEEVPTTVRTNLDAGVAIDEDFEVIEVTVAADSDLADQTFAEARLRERFGVNVIGVWFDGQFETPIEPGDVLEDGTRLLVAGEYSQVEELREATTSAVRRFSSQDIVLAGYGDSGKAAYEALARTSSRLTVLDIEAAKNVDVIGDARDPDVLREAGIEDASALVLTVADDTTAIFTTLIARELNPDLQIVVRANEEEDVQKLYRAGADYVQSLATVSGRMLASTAFEDEEVLAYDKQISVVRMPAADLTGETLVEADVRAETGSTVVAIIRDEATITEFEPVEFTFRADDEVVVAGTDDAITRFERQFSG